MAAYIIPYEIGQQFVIQATARPGGDLKKVETAIEEELADFLQSGPKEEEVRRVRTQFMANFIRGVQRIGGFGGKSDVLASSEVYLGSPDAYQVKLQRVRQATTAQLRSAAERWLSDGVYVLEVHPFPHYKVASAHADRSRLPDTGPPPDLKFPKLQRTTLSNGLKVVLAERHEVPVVNFWLDIDAGYAADQFATPGTARLTTSLLDGGTKTRNALQISDELALLGPN